MAFMLSTKQTTRSTCQNEKMSTAWVCEINFEAKHYRANQHTYVLLDSEFLGQGRF